MLSDKIDDFCNQTQMRVEEFSQIINFLSSKNYCFEKLSNIPIEKDISKQYILSKGTQSYVLNGINNSTGEKVAIKLLKTDQNMQNLIQQEQDIIKNVKIKKYIVEVYEQYYLEDLNILIQIMELCKTSLDKESDNRIESQELYSDKEMIQIFISCINCLYELNANDIQHLNIKPSKILISQDGNYKLTDLCLKRYNNQNIQRTFRSQNNQKTFLSPEQLHLLQQTGEKISEIVEKQEKNEIKQYPTSQFSSASDIYSMGLALLKVLGLELNDKMILLIQDQKAKQLEDDINSEYKNFVSFSLNYMLQKDINKRYSAAPLRNKFIFFYDYAISIPDETERIRKIIQEYEDQKIQKDKYYVYLQLQLSQNDKKNKEISGIEESLNILERIQQQPTIDKVIILQEYSKIQTNINEHQRALEINEKSYEILRMIRPYDDLEISNQIELLADNFYDTGKLQNCLDYTLKSLQIKKNLFNDNHPDIADLLNLTSFCYSYLSDYQNSLQYGLQALQMSRLYYNKDHPTIADALRGVGFCYYGLGEYSQSREYLTQALKMRESLYTQIHRKVAQTIDNIGSTYYMENDYEQSLHYELKALSVRQQINPINYTEIALSYNNIGSTLEFLNQNQKSIIFYKKSININKIIYKGNHTELARTYKNCGRVFLTLDDYNKCIAYYQKSLRMREKMYPATNTQITTLKQDLKEIKKFI